MRSRYGQEPGETGGKKAVSAREEAPAEEEQALDEKTLSEEQTLNAQAAQVQNPHLKNTDPSLVADELAGAGKVNPDLALTAVEQGGTPETLGDQAPIDAQIGSAVWRLSPHGKTEGDVAASAGVILPGSPEAELADEADLNQARNALFTEGEEDPDASGAQRLTRQEEAAAVLDLSEAGKGKGESKGISVTDQVKLEAAQSRNQLISQISAGGEQAAGEGLESEVAQNFLRQRLQANGLLQRGASAVVKPAADSKMAMPLVANASGNGAVDATRIFETPMDDAVQQRAIDQVAQEARWMVNNRKHEVTLRLYPEHLGDVHMKVAHKDGTLRIEMTVDTLAAKHLLESNMNGLRDRLIGDHLADEFLFNVDIRKDHQHPDMQGRAPQDAAPRGSRLDSLSMAAESAPQRRVMNHTGWSIYA